MLEQGKVLREVDDEVAGTKVRIVTGCGMGPLGPGADPVPLFFVESVPVLDGAIAENDDFQVIAIGPYGPEARFTTLEGANGFVDAMLAFDATQAGSGNEYDENGFWDLVGQWEGR